MNDSKVSHYFLLLLNLKSSISPKTTKKMKDYFLHIFNKCLIILLKGVNLNIMGKFFYLIF